MADAKVSELIADVCKFRDRRDWLQFHNPKDLAITLVLEATEVLEHMQWRNGAELDSHLAARRDQVAEELADVLNVLLLLADRMEIDIVKAFKKKLRINASKYPVHKSRGTAKKYTDL